MMMMIVLTNLLIRKVNLVVSLGVLAALVMYISLMGFIDMVIIFVTIIIIITIIANLLLRTQPFRLSTVPEKREPEAPIHFQSYSSTIQRLRRGMSALLGRPILVEFYKRQLIVDRQMSKVVLFPRWAQLPA